MGSRLESTCVGSHHAHFMKTLKQADSAESLCTNEMKASEKNLDS
jgi:hypothetical protein